MAPEPKPAELRRIADRIRDDVIAVSVRNGAGHIAPSLSAVDILVALYYRVIRHRPDEPDWDARDRVIFSKAHGAYAQYAILADQGTIPREEWEGFYTERSSLMGCSERRLSYGLEAGCGSLGHGLPLAVGLALGARHRGRAYRVFCVVGDGELQEGTTWEALQFAVKHRVDNLCVVVDQNRLQAMGRIEEIMDVGPGCLADRLRGFGLDPVVCPGHDAGELARVIEEGLAAPAGRPIAVLAQTVKGHGLRCMEDVAKFHFRLPTEEELAKGKTYGRS